LFAWVNTVSLLKKYGLHPITAMRLGFYLRYILLLAFVSFAGGASAEDHAFENEESRADSLKNILKTQSLTENQKMAVYRNITQIYAAFDPDSVMVYARKAIALAQKQKDYVTLCGLYNHIGAAYFFKNN